MNSFIPCDPSLFFSRQDAADPRMGELVRVETSMETSEGVAIVGYPDDEGIRLNGGREGARLGPNEIRRWLYKMTPHLHRETKAFSDLGDLNTRLGDLAERHETASAAASDLLARGRQVLSFGGGNDWAYADGIAFLRQYASAKPVIINVDAHLDVRDLERGPNSGTPFFRLLECGRPFDFIEFGIQNHCNSKAHYEYVERKGGRCLSMEEFYDSGVSLVEFSVRELGELMLKKRPCFLAIDIDAFALPLAAGSSAAWPLGLQPKDFWPLFLTWLQRLDVRAMGIYEVSPPLDVASATAKWAAQLAHGFLHDV